MSKPRVFITNKGVHAGYNQAMAFGKIIVLTEGKVNVFRLSEIKSDIMKKLDDFEATGEDFVLHSGYGVVTGIVMHYFLSKFGLVRLLLWGGNTCDYRKVTLLNDFLSE